MLLSIKNEQTRAPLNKDKSHKYHAGKRSQTKNPYAILLKYFQTGRIRPQYESQERGYLGEEGVGK